MAVTASISAYKAPDIVNALTQQGHHVQVILTKGAENFVTEMSLSTMSGRPVITTLWTEKEGEVTHIALAQRWAELFIVCPASANAVAKMANGIADDAFSTIYLAIPPEIPKMVFPAMNHIMLDSRAVQRNLSTLMDDNVIVEDTRSGRLACREIGKGLLLKTEDIINIINSKKETRK